MSHKKYIAIGIFAVIGLEYLILSGGGKSASPAAIKISHRLVEFM